MTMRLWPSAAELGQYSAMDVGTLVLELRSLSLLSREEARGRSTHSSAPDDAGGSSHQPVPRALTTWRVHRLLLLLLLFEGAARLAADLGMGSALWPAAGRAARENTGFSVRTGGCAAAARRKPCGAQLH
jgi:hypothetical protein